jgi:hypothetical protein
MKAYLGQRGDSENVPAFEPPGNIVFVTLENGINEAFINGTQPEDAVAVPAVSPVSQ